MSAAIVDLAAARRARTEAGLVWRLPLAAAVLGAWTFVRALAAGQAAVAAAFETMTGTRG